MTHDTADMGAAIVRTFLEAWEPPESRSPLVAMVRSAMTNETAMALVREYLGRRVFGPITQALGAPDAELRATLIGSQFIGLAMMRYIARIEPLASASVDQIVAAIGPDDAALPHRRPRHQGIRRRLSGLGLPSRPGERGDRPASRPQSPRQSMCSLRSNQPSASMSTMAPKPTTTIAAHSSTEIGAVPKAMFMNGA